jgi:hypothetical protein
MSVTDVLAQCSMLPDDCSTNIDGTCILKITLNCFQRAIAQATASAAVPGLQVGGGIHEFAALVPHLAARGIKEVNYDILVPAGLALPADKKSDLPFDVYIGLGTVWDAGEISDLNKELTKFIEDMGMDTE